MEATKNNTLLQNLTIRGWPKDRQYLPKDHTGHFSIP